MPQTGAIDLRVLVDQPLGRRQGSKVVPAGSGRTVATMKVKVELGDAELLANRDPHGIAPISIGETLLKATTKDAKGTAWWRRQSPAFCICICICICNCMCICIIRRCICMMKRANPSEMRDEKEGLARGVEQSENVAYFGQDLHPG